MALALRNNREYLGEEIAIERPDGSRVTVLAHASPIHDDAGRLLGAVNVLVDISDRKRSEAESAQLAAIVESSHDAIVSKTLEGCILSWNIGAERLFGYTADEAVGSPIFLIVPPERYDEERTFLARLRQGHRIENLETVRLTKDGRRVDVSLTISPVRDQTGRVVGASKVARDITEQKRTAADLMALKDELSVQVGDLQRLHEMTLRLATMRELQPILEETLRTATEIERTDRGLLLLFNADENVLEVGSSLGFNDDFLARIHRIRSGSGASGTCIQRRDRIVIEDAETDPIVAPYREETRQGRFRAVHCTPIITRAGTVVGVLATHFDRPHRPTGREQRLIDLCVRHAADSIENAQLYAQLREADRRKDEFLATLAHELRNPLAPISNSIHLLKMQGELGPTVEGVCDVMGRQVKHIVRLVDDLLDVSRIGRGRIDLRRETFELAEVIKSAVEIGRPLIEAAGHQLTVESCSEATKLEGDPVRLAQVIANLLNNAAKYTEPDGQGRIGLAARREGNEAVIVVRDNGLGIPPEMLPRVFGMFSQIDRTLDRSQGGLGIGLTLAKSLVELHGGQIEARSEGLGRGSEFIIRLPVLPATNAPRSNGIPARGQNGTGNGHRLPVHRILVVDDARAATYVIGKLLETMGQQVYTTEDAASALKIARTERPDLVISDITMPGMDGYELARQLRQDPTLEGLVLVALTGNGQDGDRQRTRDAGFDRHLVKPVSMDDLTELLESLPRHSEPIAEPR